MPEYIGRPEYEARNLEVKEALDALAKQLDKLSIKLDTYQEKIKKDQQEKSRFVATLFLTFAAGGGFTTIVELLGHIK